MSARPRRRGPLLALVAGAALLVAAAAPNASTVTAAPVLSSAKALDPALRSQVDAIAKAALTGGVTGAVVAIHDPRKGDMLAAYGTADTAGAPMTTDLHYRIASVTKTFTATAVLELADQGRLSLDDTLDKYVPNMPNGGVITVRDLLAMRSGLFDYVADPALLAAYEKNALLPGFTLEQALDIVRAHASESVPPDTTTVYTNTNYLLLGFVIEQASGRTAARYLDDLACRTGLYATTFPTTPAMPQPASRGYTLSTSTPPQQDVTRSSVDFPWTAGAMVSTVPDMLRYAPRLASGSGLSATAWQERQQWNPLTTTGIKVDYGLGLTRFGDWLGHDGSIAGYSDVVVNRPASGTSIVVMVNAADAIAVPAVLPFVEIARLLYPDSLPTY